MSNSMFGADFGSPALNAAYDMMVLDEIEKKGEEIVSRDPDGKEGKDADNV